MSNYLRLSYACLCVLALSSSRCSWQGVKQRQRELADASETSPMPELEAGVFQDATSASDARVSKGDVGKGGTPLDPTQCPAETLPACDDGYSFWQWQEIINASQFGAGTHFTALGGDTVLMQGGDGSFIVLSLPSDLSKLTNTSISSWVFPDANLVGVDVTSGSGLRFLGPHALACQAGGSQCSLWFDENTGLVDGGVHELVEIPNSQVPAGINPRGLVAVVALDMLCVFGNGLACFDGSWSTWIAPDDSIEIREVVSGVHGEATMIVVASEGRWWMRSLGSASPPVNWAEQLQLEHADLRGAAVGGTRKALFGAEGWWSVDDAGPALCNRVGGLRGLTMADHSLLTHAVSDNGRVVSYRTGKSPNTEFKWCEAEPVALHDEPVLGFSASACENSTNGRLLTPTRLFGTSDCVATF